MRVKSNLLNGFNLIWVVQLSSQIYTSSLSPQISGYFRASRLDKRGVSRSSRTRGGMRWTRAASARKVAAGRGQPVSGSRRAGRTALMRTAKPCGPGTRGWCQAGGGESDPTGFDQPSSRAAMEARRIRLQGERGISRQTIAQGMPECSGCTCMLVCAFSMHTLHTRPRVQQAPGIPCSLVSRRDKVHANLGRNASRERERHSSASPRWRRAKRDPSPLRTGVMIAYRFARTHPDED